MALRALSNRSPTVVVETSSIASAPAKASSRVIGSANLSAPHRHPVLCEVVELVNVSAGGDDLSRRRSGSEELVDDEPA